MSVITIVRKETTCAIAADSLSCDGSRLHSREYSRNDSKIVRLGEHCFGLVGYTAHSLVFKSLIERYPNKFDLRSKRHIFESLLALHKVMKEDYFLQSSDELSGQPYESSQMDFCLANSTGIYVIESYREVLEIDRFWAIGSGSNYALGAIHARYDDESLDAEKLARVGVAAGCAFNAYCGEPIDSFSIALAIESTNPATV
ncbi:MAG: MFS transporter [Verrucomicrobiota bacterium]